MGQGRNRPPVFFAFTRFFTLFLLISGMTCLFKKRLQTEISFKFSVTKNKTRCSRYPRLRTQEGPVGFVNDQFFFL